MGVAGDGTVVEVCSPVAAAGKMRKWRDGELIRIESLQFRPTEKR